MRAARLSEGFVLLSFCYLTAALPKQKCSPPFPFVIEPSYQLNRMGISDR